MVIVEGRGWVELWEQGKPADSRTLLDCITYGGAWDEVLLIHDCLGQRRGASIGECCAYDGACWRCRREFFSPTDLAALLVLVKVFEPDGFDAVTEAVQAMFRPPPYARSQLALEGIL